MFSQLSSSEKVAISASSGVLATLAVSSSLKISVPPRYSDFIVGSIAWRAESKLQDIIVAPIFIAVIFLASVFFTSQLAKSKRQYGAAYTEDLANHLMWWSLPFIAGLASLIIGSTPAENLLLVSSGGLLLVGIASVRRGTTLPTANPLVLSLVGFAVITIGLIPIDLAMVVGRLPEAWRVDIELSQFIKVSNGITTLGLGFVAILAARNPNLLPRLLPTMLMIGQLGLCLMFVTLYPATLVQPNGLVTAYSTTIGLKILVGAIIIAGVIDVVRRHRKYAKSGEWIKLLSAVALFAILVSLKFGNTVAPRISSDDYHFGEGLLGWWSYLQGSVPYVDYFPAHGLIDDDLTGLLSSIFYDGTGGTLWEVNRLSFALLSFASFISVYLFSQSIGLAFVSTCFLGGRLSWFFLAIFACLWFSRELRQNPSKWLSVWILTAPIVILGNPPQGLLLVAASGPMAGYFAWTLLRDRSQIIWRYILIACLILTVSMCFTPIYPMIMGAIIYVIENGPINQLAYGIPWHLSLPPAPTRGFIFEVIRMSWVLVPVVLLLLGYSAFKNHTKKATTILPSIVALIFILLMIPYSMGRIDPGGMSRLGLTSVFSITTLLPIAVWWSVKSTTRVPLILLTGFFGSLLNYAPLSMSSLISAASPRVGTGSLKDGKEAGLTNLGRSFVEEDHWQRLVKLGNLLNQKLAAKESYLDLSSRNAHYFYLDRRPLLAVTALYNLVPLSQQKKAVAKIRENPPKIALLEGSNISHDGGGPGLRNHYLYRFIMDSYVPRYEDGFVIGYARTDLPSNYESTIDFPVRDVTNDNWVKGVHLGDAAIMVDAPGLIPLLKVGDEIELANGDRRRVSKIKVEDNSIWFDGGPIDPKLAGYPARFHTPSRPEIVQEYQTLLYERAFPLPDLQKIPISWGRSVNSLNKKMSLVRALDGVSARPHHLDVEKNNYKISGSNPSLTYGFEQLGISGNDAGLLKFDFICSNKTGDSRLKIYWWGDNFDSPSDAASIKFTGDNGTLVVPLDASPRWVRMKLIKGIKVEIADSASCTSIALNNLGLFNRVF